MRRCHCFGFRVSSESIAGQRGRCYKAVPRLESFPGGTIDPSRHAFITIKSSQLNPRKRARGRPGLPGAVCVSSGVYPPCSVSCRIAALQALWGCSSKAAPGPSSWRSSRLKQDLPSPSPGALQVPGSSLGSLPGGSGNLAARARAGSRQVLGALRDKVETALRRRGQVREAQRGGVSTMDSDGSAAGAGPARRAGRAHPSHLRRAPGRPVHEQEGDSEALQRQLPEQGDGQGRNEEARAEPHDNLRVPGARVLLVT